MRRRLLILGVALLTLNLAPAIAADAATVAKPSHATNTAPMPETAKAKSSGAVHGDAAPADLPPAATSSVPLTRDKEVVLFAGLPGDVVHERNYQEELQHFLTLLAAPGNRPKKVWVFVDQPDAIKLPAGLDGEVLPSKREAFMALPPRMLGRDTPLLAVIFGHGGKQGGETIFHVRGPRLLPADLAKWAEQRNAAASDWLLYFDGSGAFAHVLAGPDREIITSEDANGEAQEPVGLSLAREILQSEPTLTFKSWGERLAGAVEAWYSQRKLSETEKPTWWSAEQKTGVALDPAKRTERVAAADSVTPAKPHDDASPAPKPETEAAAEGDDSTAPTARSSQAAPMPANLPEGWEGIERVKPTDYPKDDTVALAYRIKYVLGDTPAVTEDREMFVQILTEEGKSSGDHEISIEEDEDVKILAAEILMPDGKIATVKEDDILSDDPHQEDGYPVGGTKHVSFPGVEPGAIIRLSYRRVWKKYPLPYVSLDEQLAYSTPLKVLSIEFTSPTKDAFKYAFSRAPAVEPKTSKSRYGTTSSWEWKDVPALRQETLEPPEYEPRLLVSNCPDWKAFTTWYWRLTREADNVTDEIKETAEEVTEGAKTDREKLEALYGFVTNMRYISVPLGINSFRPHAAANVLRNHFGDCKDKANLLNTLLAAVGIKSDLVLVPRMSQADEALPGFFFNHAISHVHLGDTTMWVDTTDDNCRFGLLPPGDPGRHVLVADGKTVALQTLPQPDPEKHRLDLKTNITSLDESAGALTGRIDANTTGYVDYAWRAAAADEHAKNWPLLADDYELATGFFSIARQRATPTSALEKDFAWRGEGTFTGLLTTLPGTEGKSALRAPFWLPAEWRQALSARTAPLYINEGYPMFLHQEINFPLAAAANATLPAARKNEAGPLPWSVEWKQEGDRVVATMQAKLLRGELTEAETAPAQESLRGLIQAISASAVYTPAK